MDSIFVKKNKCGIAAIIIFIILLSQYRTFNFLIYNILGRLILVVIILAITSMNVLLGIIAVLMVSIMVNLGNGDYLEGFQDNQTLLNSAISTTNGGSKAREGFNIIENERVIQNGKNSKQFSNVNFSDSNSLDNVEPANILVSMPATLNMEL